MRTFIFAAALVLVSAAASAGPSREIVLAAASDSPNAVAVQQPKVAQPVPPAALPAAEKPAEKSSADKPAARKRETDEAKARRIAARYGIFW